MMTSELFSLRGEVAVVTGATGLLGREHCKALVGASAHVVAVDLDEASARELSEMLTRESGISCLGLRADVRDRASIERVRDVTMSTFRRIDVLVNNAAVDDKFETPALAAEQSRFEEYPLAMWQRMMDVNVTGTFLTSQVLGAVMAEQGRGSIINIASTYGLVAPQQSLYRGEDGSQSFWKSPAYPTTKGAVVQFTRFLAAYWASRGVRVNALCPGGVENGQEPEFQRAYAARTPLGRMAKPDDYRGALVYLASPASAYMTGAIVVVDGGWTVW